MPTLTVDFTPSNPLPTNGYTLRYKPVGSTDPYTEVTGRFTNPIAIPNVDANTDYEGQLVAVCSATLQSTVTPFTATGVVYPQVTVEYSTSAGALTECLGNDYPTTRTVVTGSIPAAVAYDITFAVGTTYRSCTGTESPGEYTITITAGQLSGQLDVLTETTVDCGQSDCRGEYTEFTLAHRIVSGNATIA
jgi:hypothetical protein